MHTFFIILSYVHLSIPVVSLTGFYKLLKERLSAFNSVQMNMRSLFPGFYQESCWPCQSQVQ